MSIAGADEVLPVPLTLLPWLPSMSTSHAASSADEVADASNWHKRRGESKGHVPQSVMGALTELTAMVKAMPRGGNDLCGMLALYVHVEALLP